MRGELPLDLGELTIRRLRHTDFAALYAVYSHEDVARYQVWEPLTLEQTAQLFDVQGSGLAGAPEVPLILPVELKAEERVIGDVVLTIAEEDVLAAEIGCCFHPEYHGRGFATRAVAAVVRYAFESLEVQRVWAVTDSRNERSWMLLERIGLRREAGWSHRSFVKGEWISDYRYTMSADDWHCQHLGTPG